MVPTVSGAGGVAQAEGQPAAPRIWNKLPDAIAEAVIELVIKQPEWLPRELATAFVASNSIVLERRRSTDVMDCQDRSDHHGGYGMLPPIKLGGGGTVIRCWT
jgi:hypothetical protein